MEKSIPADPHVLGVDHLGDPEFDPDAQDDATVDETQDDAEPPSPYTFTAPTGTDTEKA